MSSYMVSAFKTRLKYLFSGNKSVSWIFWSIGTLCFADRLVVSATSRLTKFFLWASSSVYHSNPQQCEVTGHLTECWRELVGYVSFQEIFCSHYILYKQCLSLHGATHWIMFARQILLFLLGVLVPTILVCLSMFFSSNFEHRYPSQKLCDVLASQKVSQSSETRLGLLICTTSMAILSRSKSICPPTKKNGNDISRSESRNTV